MRTACFGCCRYEFQAREQEVAELENLALSDLKATFKAHFLPGSPERRKLAIHVVGKSHAPELRAAAPDGVERAEDPAALYRRFDQWPRLPDAAPTVAGAMG